MTSDLTGAFKCDLVDCFYARPYRPKEHVCITATGDNIPSATNPEKGRKSKRMSKVQDVSFHQLPAEFKVKTWASFVSASNPHRVPAKLFPGSQSLSPFAYAFAAPGFGPSKVTKQSNAAGPGKRTLGRAERVQGSSGSGEASGSRARATGAGDSAMGSGSLTPMDTAATISITDSDLDVDAVLDVSGASAAAGATGATGRAGAVEAGKPAKRRRTRKDAGPGA